MNATKIEGSIALVTGANRGIGRALTEALLHRGVKKVYATARNPEDLRDLRDPRVVPLRLDVTDAIQTRAAVKAAPDVELVFSNAGVALMGGLADASVLDDARRQMEVNYFGPLQLIHHLAPTLARNGGGAVVCINSAAGLSNISFMPTYSASKAALHSLTQGARALLAAQGTAVFGVYPGPVDTDMSRAIDLPKASPRDVASAILDGVAAGKPEIFPDAFAEDFRRQLIRNQRDFTATITVDQTPAEAFAAVTNPRGWWSETIEGGTAKLGDQFFFEVPDVHRSRMTLTEVIPGKRVVWRVSDSYLAFVEDKTEWDGTDVVFDISEIGGKTEVRFTHVGLAAQECFQICSNAWGSYITGSLRRLIETGKGAIVHP